METGSQVERTHDKAGGPGEAVAGEQGSPSFTCRKARRNNWEVIQTKQPRVLVQGNKASKPLTENNCGS